MADIKEWIRNNLKAGYSKEKIKKALIESGYNPNLVDEVIKERLIYTENNSNLMANALVVSVITLIVVVVVSLYLVGQLNVMSIDIDKIGNKTSNLNKNVNNLIKITSDLTNDTDRTNNRVSNLNKKVDSLINITSDLVNQHKK